MTGARPRASASAPASPPPASAPAAHETVRPKSAPPQSGVVANVLFFFALSALFLVAVYYFNKDAPKEMSPFEGGPPPAMAGGAKPNAAPSARAGAAASEAAPPPIVVEVRLGPGIEPPPGGVLFAIVRNAGMPNRGPPVAVQKIDAPTWPSVTLKVGPEQVMMPGLPFSGPFDVYVRWDADGNAMTKAPGDLKSKAPAEKVAPGATVSVVLDERL